MNILVTGRGTSGSFQIRGEQLGRAMGATVIPKALDVAAFDLAVLVKRPGGDLVDRIHQAGVPLVWDVVDSWPQPEGNGWAMVAAHRWLAAQFQAIRPAAIVAATRAMARDCEELGVPVLWLPHHSRPDIEVNPIRDEVRTVGYEGSEQHLGRWRRFLELECSRRGWRFVMNPARLADLDIVVGLRDAAGYPARNWKSGVKLANAQASGTPCVMCAEAGAVEMASGAECWADTQLDVRQAFDALEPVGVRRERAIVLRSKAPRLESIAGTYKAWLEALSSSSPPSDATPRAGACSSH